ncbi:MAG: GGDEF domain-containing protein, partial [Hydrogenophaga sp.]|uniref:GGDEF domain-containing protein n=1 Tax=Hydrogenophaga sp. TaxID=1904254 RepID=UPI0026392F98
VLADGDYITIGGCVLKFMQRSSVEARYHEEIYQRATRDALTGLCNRRLFLELLERELQRSVQRGYALALLIIDLDHFKSINDSHGHVVGDRVLEQVGAVLQAVARGNALAARIGGEEFAIALPEHDAAAARAVAERIRANVEALPLRLGEQVHTLTVSVGVASWRPGWHTVGQVLAAADQALYRAKEAGRNRVEAAT